ERDPSRFLSECADLPLVASAKNASRRSLAQPAFFSTRWTLPRIAKALPSVPVRRMRGRGSVGWSGTDASGPHMGDRARLILEEVPQAQPSPVSTVDAASNRRAGSRSGPRGNLPRLSRMERAARGAAAEDD